LQQQPLPFGIKPMAFLLQVNHWAFWRLM